VEISFFKPSITQADKDAVCQALDSGWLTYGQVNLDFEKDLCEYTGASFALTVNSCTAALHLALIAVGVKEGDYVITTPYTFVATANAIRYVGAIPLFVDVDYNYNIDPEKVSEALYADNMFQRVKAVIAVDFAGVPCDYDRLRTVLKGTDIPIIGDAAHSLGATYKGKKIGSVADITCFSFYATKTMTTGDGGAILTDNKKWAEKIRLYGLNGLDKGAWKRYADKNMWRYDAEVVGYKFNMPGINAALGRSQLKRLDEMRLKRWEIMSYYNDTLDGHVALPPYDPGMSAHLYVIGVNHRDMFVQKMAERGVHCSVHCIPVPSFTAYGKQDLTKWPTCVKLFQSAVSLPIYPDMDGREVGYVSSCVRELTEDDPL
jgi:dTDP-4-amino-4,6-dideoxygalactose transaminase